MRCTLLALYLFICSNVAVSQQVSNQVYLNECQQLVYIYLDSDGLHAWNESTRKDTVLSTEYSNPYSSQLSVSKDGIIAFITLKREGEAPNRNPLTDLHLLDATGHSLRALHTKNAMRKLAWSPGGKSLAFIAGVEDSHFYKTYVNAETYLYNLGDEAPVKIADGGYDLVWAPFDNNIYIFDSAMTPKANRYNPTTRILQPTDYKGIHFSPDGLHYYVARDEGQGMDVYLSDTNNPVPLLQGKSLTIEPKMWLNNDCIIGMIQSGTSRLYDSPHYVVNVTSGEVKRAKSVVVHSLNCGNVLVEMADGIFEVENLDKMERVDRQSLPLLPGETE